MARLRKPSHEHEAKGDYRKNPARRREDPPGKGELPAFPPDHLHLSEDEQQAWVEIVAGIPEGMGSGSDAISVEMASRLVALIRGRDESVTTATYNTLGNLLSRLGMDPQGRMRLAPLAGKKKPVADPLDKWTVSPLGQRGTISAGGTGAN